MLDFFLLSPGSAKSAGRTGLLLLSGWLALAHAAAAQTAPLDSLGGLTAKLRQHEARDPHEKLLLHLDRPLYLSGETMWFKVYAVEGTTGHPLPLSSVAYVEVLNARHQLVLQGKVALREATGQGSFLLPTGLPAGAYTVCAYTSWMRNFEPDTYFHTMVTVVNTGAASGATGKDSATYDAQFFPEGGNLVRGLPGRVGFKITNRAGRGVAATGKVLNQRGAVVATFQTLRLGMGSFELTPAPGPDAYTAVVQLPNGQPLTRDLPRALEQGYALRLDQTDPARLRLTVTASPGRPATVYLLGHAHQHIALATRLTLANGQASTTLERAALPEGITHFTVFTAEQQPVCERLYFRPPTRTLALTARPDKAQYGIRDKVQLQVSAAEGTTPLAASLSMAVYRLDSLNQQALPALDRVLWLTSELKGTVENPDYYFTATGPEAREATDNLLLTQGWSRWRWADVLAATPPAREFLPETNGPLVRARLTRAGTQVPVPSVMTYLATPSRVVRLSNAMSNAQGLVQFELGSFNDPHEIMLQADPAQDSTSRLTVLDPFSPRYAEGRAWPVGLVPRFQADYARRHLQAQAERTFADRHRFEFAPEKVDSLAFYGKPSEQYLLDKYTRFKVMEEVLREYVPGVLVRIRKDGFHLLVVDKTNKSVLETPLTLLDGVPVFDANKIMALDPLKIRKLEVVDGRYYQGQAVYNGIVSFTTYKGDLEGFQLDPRVLVQQYEGVQRQREFYAPRYDTPAAQQSRLPDLRNLLYWNPNIDLAGPAAQTLSFYTGDQAGRYLVVLQGLSAAGRPGSTSFVMEVKPTL